MSLEYSYIYEIYITDLQKEYITSHPVSDLPGALTSMAGNPTGQSQQLSGITGISTIGGISFTILDYQKSFHDLQRSVELSGESFLNRKVIIYRGFVGQTFLEHSPILTQTISGVKYNAPKPTYTVKCEDIQRELREKIFTREDRYVAADFSIDETTTLTLNDTTGFELVYHSAAYNVLPNGFYGIAKIGKEYIGYSGVTATTLTGISRGLFNTSAQEHLYDAAKPSDKQIKVTPVVYLELPAPKLLLAIMTGDIYGDTATLPDSQHSGIDISDIDVDSFINIGDDLWDLTDDDKGWVLPAFDHKEQRAKDFIEKEILLNSLIALRVTDDGKFQLFRRTKITEDAPTVGHITDSDISKIGNLVHDNSQVINAYNILYNYDGSDYTRSIQFTDASSVNQYENLVSKTLKFQTLHTRRHTQSQISQLIDAYRALYSKPPETIQVTDNPGSPRYKVGEVIRLSSKLVRDYAGNTETIDRSFLIKGKKFNSDETVTYSLIGSTVGNLSQSLSTQSVLQPSLYTSEGTDLASVFTLVGDVVQAGNYNLPGHADLQNPAAIYYYNGDLTAANNVTLNITENVQLRINGFPDMACNINGKGASTNTGSGHVGNTRGMDGVVVYNFNSTIVPDTVWSPRKLFTEPAILTEGRNQSFPVLNLINTDGLSIGGLPNDLRGTGAGSGGSAKITDNKDGLPPYRLDVSGGAGASGSGAGLLVIAKGGSFTGNIDLSGNDSVATSVTSSGGFNPFDLYSGAGASTGGGSFLFLTDGPVFPVINNFISKTGLVPINGNLMDTREVTLSTSTPPPYAGFPAQVLSNIDNSGSAIRIQFIPPPEIPFEDIETEEVLNTYYSYHSSAYDVIPATPTGDGTTGGWHKNYIVGDVWRSSKLSTSRTTGQWDVAEPYYPDFNFSFIDNFSQNWNDVLSLPANLSALGGGENITDVTDYTSPLINNEVITDAEGQLILDYDFSRSLTDGLGVWWTTNTGASITSEGEYGGATLRIDSDSTTRFFRVRVNSIDKAYNTIFNERLYYRVKFFVSNDWNGNNRSRFDTLTRLDVGAANNVFQIMDTVTKGAWVILSGFIDIAQADALNSDLRIRMDASATLGHVLVETFEVSKSPFVYEGDIDATVGASWPTNLSGRPAELTDGRVPGTIKSPAILSPGVSADQGGGLTRRVSLGLEPLTVLDGNIVTFDDVWDAPPVVRFSGGLTSSPALTGAQQQIFQALNLSVSGFTADLTLKELSGVPSVIVDTGAVSGTPDLQIGKTNNPSVDNLYLFQFDVEVTNELFVTDYIEGSVTVGLYSNDGSGWVLRGSKTFSGSTTAATTNHFNATLSITVSGLTNHAGNEFGISITDSLFGGSLLSFDSVTYNVVAAPVETTATPSGAFPVSVFLLGGT